MIRTVAGALDLAANVPYNDPVTLTGRGAMARAPGKRKHDQKK